MTGTTHLEGRQIEGINKHLESIAKSLEVLADDAMLRMPKPTLIKENELPDYLKVDSDLLDSLTIRK